MANVNHVKRRAIVAAAALAALAALSGCGGPHEAAKPVAGASVQNHTLTHPDLKGAPYQRQRQEICGTSQRFTAAFGRRPFLLRPPYGSFDATTVRAARDCGITRLIGWSAEIAHGKTTFAAGDRLCRGDIVLMHFRSDFAADITEFVRQAKRAGLAPAVLEDYVK